MVASCDQCNIATTYPEVIKKCSKLLDSKTNKEEAKQVMQYPSIAVYSYIPLILP